MSMRVGTRLSDLIVFHGKDGDLVANPGPTMAHADIDFILFHPPPSLPLEVWIHSYVTFALKGKRGGGQNKPKILRTSHMQALLPSVITADKDDRQHVRGHHLREEHQLFGLRVGPAGPDHRQPGAVGAQRQLGIQAAGRQGPRTRIPAPQSEHKYPMHNKYEVA